MPADEWGGRGSWTDWEHHLPLWPIVTTFLAVIVWLIFIMVYALEWSKNYSTFQNIIVTIVTLVIMALFIGLGWIAWGIRHTDRWVEHEPSNSSW